MIGIEAAQNRIRESITPGDAVVRSLTDALGQVLAEDVASDIDSPPYDKALVDGFALRSADVAAGLVDFEIVEELFAGDVPRRTILAGQTARIMTGAPVPPGADAVVMVERTRTQQNDRVIVDPQPLTRGQSIMRQGRSINRGQVVLQSGCRLRPVEIGLLAEIGRDKVRVFPTPQVALIQTGDELVSAGEPLRAGQIRNSNGPMLQTLVRRGGAVPIDLGIARDDVASLTERIQRGLDADFLLLSGGVSAGQKDLVPSVLDQLGVREVFHKVDIRPGKPIWFGAAESSTGTSLVFGLPGNPVSSLVCFAVFVAPAIAQRAGLLASSPSDSIARLVTKHTIRGPRPTFWPAIRRLESDAMRETVQLLDWHGSADLCTLTAANCLAFFPTGDRDYAADELVRVIPLD